MIDLWTLHLPAAVQKPKVQAVVSFQINFSSCISVTAAVFSLIPYEGYSTPQAPPQQSAGGLQVDFESVFGAKAAGSNSLNSEGEDFIYIKVYIFCV